MFAMTAERLLGVLLTVGQGRKGGRGQGGIISGQKLQHVEEPGGIDDGKQLDGAGQWVRWQVGGREAGESTGTVRAKPQVASRGAGCMLRGSIALRRWECREVVHCHSPWLTNPGGQILAPWPSEKQL